MLKKNDARANEHFQGALPANEGLREEQDADEMMLEPSMKG